MKNILEFSKQLLTENLSSDAIVVDATVGNGNDTVFLCNNFKFVYGFDIQESAIERAKELLVNNLNYELILSSHEYIDKYVSKCDGAIFNLGYLPNHDHSVTTISSSTIVAIEKLLNIIKSGIIVIVAYTGHDNGSEAREVEKFLSTIDKNYEVIKYQIINRTNAPYILAIKV